MLRDRYGVFCTNEYKTQLSLIGGTHSFLLDQRLYWLIAIRLVVMSVSLLVNFMFSGKGPSSEASPENIEINAINLGSLCK